MDHSNDDSVLLLIGSVVRPEVETQGRNGVVTTTTVLSNILEGSLVTIFSDTRQHVDDFRILPTTKREVSQIRQGFPSRASLKVKDLKDIRTPVTSNTQVLLGTFIGFLIVSKHQF